MASGPWRGGCGRPKPLEAMQDFRTRRGPGAQPPRARVAIDMDETIADSLAKQLRLYNEAFGEARTLEELDGCELSEVVGPERAGAARAICQEGSFFADLEPMPGAREVVRALSERYEVFVASAAMEVPASFGPKYAWMREHFPFVPSSHIVFCGDKGVLDTDYLIDDTPRHFTRFRGTPILFDAPHNRNERRFTRVMDWSDVRRLLLGDASG